MINSVYCERDFELAKALNGRASRLAESKQVLLDWTQSFFLALHYELT